MPESLLSSFAFARLSKRLLGQLYGLSILPPVAFGENAQGMAYLESAASEKVGASAVECAKIDATTAGTVAHWEVGHPDLRGTTYECQTEGVLASVRLWISAYTVAAGATENATLRAALWSLAGAMGTPDYISNPHEGRHNPLKVIAEFARQESGIGLREIERNLARLDEVLSLLAVGSSEVTPTVVESFAETLIGMVQLEDIVKQYNLGLREKENVRKRLETRRKADEDSCENRETLNGQTRWRYPAEWANEEGKKELGKRQ